MSKGRYYQALLVAEKRPFAYQASEYKIKTCREVSFKFAKNGFEAINCYTLKQANQSKLTGYCFDDLDAEQQIKHFDKQKKNSPPNILNKKKKNSSRWEFIRDHHPLL